MMEMIVPDWPAPAQVRACTTTRAGGVSAAPYDSFNLAQHVGDDAHSVGENRARLAHALRLPNEPCWLEQVHGMRVIEAGDPDPRADACWTDRPDTVLAVLTADCLPVLLYTAEGGGRIAAAHAGWRGLCSGVIEASVAALRGTPGQTLAWLGPAIGPRAFVVGDEVRAAFLAHDAAATACFEPAGVAQWHADLYALARLRLRALGITAVHGGGLCAHGDAARFYSYRRDHLTGRMATLIWMADGYDAPPLLTPR
jgi:hypothetical protein